MKRGSVLGVFLVGSILFVTGAARSWGEAGFELAIGFIFIHLALAVRARDRSWSLPDQAFRQFLNERGKQDQKSAEAIKVGDRIELQSIIRPPPNVATVFEALAICVLHV